MDPALASVLTALIASVGAIVIAVITGRNSAERLNDRDLIRRLRKKIVDLKGNPDDV